MDVHLLEHALANDVPSAQWMGIAPCSKNVVFVWWFLLLVRARLDATPPLAQAVGELILFVASLEAAATEVWETKASGDAKAYRDQ